MLILNTSNETKQYGYSPNGGLLRSFCIIGPPISGLTNETQHKYCHFRPVFCKRIVPPLLSYPIRAEISVTPQI